MTTMVISASLLLVGAVVRTTARLSSLVAMHSLGGILGFQHTLSNAMAACDELRMASSATL